jgi:hypothetical protein
MRAKIELIDKQGRRFCKNCASFKVFASIKYFQAPSMSSLSFLWYLLAQDGPSLPVAQYLYWPQELQGFYQSDLLCM